MQASSAAMGTGQCRSEIVFVGQRGQIGQGFALFPRVFGLIGQDLRSGQLVAGEDLARVKKALLDQPHDGRTRHLEDVRRFLWADFVDHLALGHRRAMGRCRPASGRDRVYDHEDGLEGACIHLDLGVGGGGRRRVRGGSGACVGLRRGSGCQLRLPCRGLFQADL